jgi:hypothetical protein
MHIGAHLSHVTYWSYSDMFQTKLSTFRLYYPRKLFGSGHYNGIELMHITKQFARTVKSEDGQFSLKHVTIRSIYNVINKCLMCMNLLILKFVVWRWTINNILTFSQHNTPVWSYFINLLKLSFLQLIFCPYSSGFILNICTLFSVLSLDHVCHLQILLYYMTCILEYLVLLYFF